MISLKENKDEKVSVALLFIRILKLIYLNTRKSTILIETKDIYRIFLTQRFMWHAWRKNINKFFKGQYIYLWRNHVVKSANKTYFYQMMMFNVGELNKILMIFNVGGLNKILVSFDLIWRQLIILASKIGILYK